MFKVHSNGIVEKSNKTLPFKAEINGRMKSFKTLEAAIAARVKADSEAFEDARFVDMCKNR